MATSRFDARLVRDKAQAAIDEQFTKRERASEDALQSYVGEIVSEGIWPFKRYHVRTRTEAEERYGREGSLRTTRYWVERPFNLRIQRIREILLLSKAAVGPSVRMGTISDGFVTLNSDEAQLIGLHEVDAV
ncbi:hypothetical protein [Pseudaminobacter sp. NGMCC 1.201702]|uniref:hypothetical protein n=1 Tax=Pseudaminobacter sp. NGMCC 1.201702 TaxID=3391825 RepID=UPI0039EFBDB6